jgi:hypothetical protein
MERAKVKRNHFDDETMERMKKYYRIDDHGELLRFIKSHELKDYNLK